jgi:hypothetical protein
MITIITKCLTISVWLSLILSNVYDRMRMGNWFFRWSGFVAGSVSLAMLSARSEGLLSIGFLACMILSGVMIWRLLAPMAQPLRHVRPGTIMMLISEIAIGTFIGLVTRF